MLDQLPENLIIEILSWLPVKSLLQYKSVSKSWYKIIKSRYFMSVHLKHNYVRRTNNCFIAQFDISQAGGELMPELIWHGEKDESNTIHDYLSLQHDPPYNYDICGPCYGIYYLWRSCVGEHDSHRPRRLWNPALHEAKKLPPMIMKPNISSNMKYFNEVCGFGFDPVTMDYKVVAIKGYAITSDRYGLMDYPLSIMIYSLRTDSWKYSGDLSKHYYIPRANSCHAFVNRSFYWLGSYEKDPFKHDVIIAIDLATEECQEIKLPDICIKGSSMTRVTYSECLMVYNGSIALVALHNQEREFDIWTLKGTTWSKELTMELDRWVWKPLGHYSADNNLVVFANYLNCLILCDPDTKETSELKVHVKDGNCKIVSAYKESLVPLNDRNFWDQSDEHQRILV
ncbi:F-box protein CPR1-like [Silene latifolia]|uniref:F-box protein CPR1-like n=1 Tax=Silene latifolia TaxID=37657 RepID=UPI003D76EAE1